MSEVTRESSRGSSRKAKAVTKNCHILKGLVARVASDEEVKYVEACKKLEKWLDSEKAYYLEAQEPVRMIHSSMLAFKLLANHLFLVS